MPNMQYAYSILQDSVEDLVGIPSKRNDANSRFIGDSHPSLRKLGNEGDGFSNPQTHRRRDRIAESTDIGGNFAEISSGLLAELDNHSARKARKAASTSSSFTMPL